MRYTFEWDPRKANENRRKHKISFERAAHVFLDPLQVSVPDQEHSETEDRWVTMGQNSNRVLLIVVHTFREYSDEECRIRIISARKATKKERKQYEELRS